jgi:integrase/recombinase XerD
MPKSPKVAVYLSEADVQRLLGVGGKSKKPKRKKKTRSLPVWLSEEEAARLVAAAPTSRDQVIILTMLYAGLRVGEVMALRVERVDWRKRQIFVFRGKNDKDRYVPIAGKLAGPLAGWIAGRTEGYVFRSPRSNSEHLTVRSVQYMVKAAAHRAGIKRPDPSQRLSPHKCRHTFCSRLVEKGVDIAAVRDLAGHSSIATTSIYLHASTDRLRDSVERL